MACQTEVNLRCWASSGGEGDRCEIRRELFRYDPWLNWGCVFLGHKCPNGPKVEGSGQETVPRSGQEIPGAAKSVLCRSSEKVHSSTSDHLAKLDEAYFLRPLLSLFNIYIGEDSDGPIYPCERTCGDVEGEDTMQKMTVIVVGCVIGVLGLAAFLRGLSGDETAAPEPPSLETTFSSQSSVRSAARSAGMARTEPVVREGSAITKEEFDEMPEEDQNEAMEAFISGFWAMESGAAADDEYISLDLFGRPYMSTMTEDEFWQLSPEDQEKAIAEIMDSCRESRRRINEIITQAQVSIAGNDYVQAEAHLLSSLERGRELSANRDGLLITRLVGIACQKAALNEMVGLYTRLGDERKAQSSRQYLQDLDAEGEQMRQAASQSEG